MLATWNIRGADVAACTAGGGSRATPLLLLHGYTGSYDDWHVVVPDLAQDRPVVRYDQRGHGRSARHPAEAYTFDELLADLVAVIEQLDAGPVHLLGHSMGGCVSLRCALDRPDLLASLVLMDTAARPATPLPLDLIEGVAEMGRTQGMQAVADMVGPLFAGARPEGAPAPVERPGGNGASLAQMDAEAFSRFAAELNTYGPFNERLAEISMPTTVIVGENDDGLRDAAIDFRDGIAGSVLEVIADAGHSPQDDQPAAWLSAVRSHLDRCEESSSGH